MNRQMFFVIRTIIQAETKQNMAINARKNRPKHCETAAIKLFKDLKNKLYVSNVMLFFIYINTLSLINSFNIN